MRAVDPLLVAAPLTALAGGLAALEVAARLKTGHPIRKRRPVDTRVGAWAAEVRRRLPTAFDAQQVTAAGFVKEGARPRPTIVGAGQPTPVGVGWQWNVNLPGMSQAEDWNASRIVAALNVGDHIGAVGEVHHTSEGWMRLSVWKNDHLNRKQEIPWRPGDQPKCCRPGVVCIGPQRNGEHIHFTITSPEGTNATLCAGRRKSGKSETMRLMLAQICGWGWGAPVVFDLVRRGVDYAAFRPLLEIPVVTDIADAKTILEVIRQESLERADMLLDRGDQVITRFDADKMPLRTLVWDEVHAAKDDSDVELALRRIAQETRPLGYALVIATQYPTERTIDTTLRMQMANAWCGRVRNATESRVVFGSLPEGDGPHLIRGVNENDPGAGKCFADVDGPDLLQGRSWFMSRQWLADHVGILAERQRAGVRT